MGDDVLVYVDTTAMFDDVTMSRTRWMQLLSLAARGDVQVVLSEVVLRETARHHARQVESTWDHVAAALPKLRGRLKELEGLGADVSGLSLPLEAPTYQFDGASAAHAARERLDRLGVRIVPLPQIAHEQVLERDFAQRKPFASTGKGYRDTLIWETLKEVLRTATPGAHVIFVTDNKSDFCDDKGDLHSQLKEEIAELPVTVTRVHNLDELLGHAALEDAVNSLAKSDEELQEFLRQAPEHEADEVELPELDVDDVIASAVSKACEDLFGESIRTASEAGEHFYGGLDFEDLDIPSDISDPTIEEVIPEADSTEWQTYETYEGGTLLVRASVIADVTLDGYVFKADFYVMDRDDVTVTEWDWNEHMVRVSITLRARLVFQLRVESRVPMVQEVEFDAAEALGVH